MKQFRGISWCGRTIVGSLFRCGGGIVRCLFNLLYYVIWWLHPITKKLQFSRNKFMKIWHWQIPSDENNLGVFLAVAETIFGSLLCCSVGIVHCLFKSFALRHFVIATVCITKKLQFSRINLWPPPPKKKKLLGSISSYLEWPRLCFN